MLNLMDSFEHSVDNKGRLVLPSVHRDLYRHGGVLSLRGDHLALYDPASWTVFMERLRVLRDEQTLSRSEFNSILGSSSEVTPDAQGRIGISARIRAAARIEDKVVILGVDDYLAVYRPDAVPSPEMPELADLMSKLDGLGL